MQQISLWELCEGNLEGASFTGDPEGYVEKALETGISLHTGPTMAEGNLEQGSSTVDFERWMKGAPEVEPLSLRVLCGEGWKEGLLYWEPWRICKGRLWIQQSLSIGAPL